jgi:hypothetical protein
MKPENQSEHIEKAVVENYKKKPMVTDTFISSHEVVQHGYIRKEEK